MPILKYIPISCRVQDFLNALSATMDRHFVIVGPDGIAITTNLVDIPMIGLTTKEGHPDRPFGFTRPTANYDLTIPSKYDADAVLILKVATKELPEELRKMGGTIWLLELKDDHLIEYYQEIAVRLNDEFKNLNVTVVIVPEGVTDEDTKHLAPRPVNAVSPTITYCPLICKTST